MKLEWVPNGLADWSPKQSLRKHGKNFTVEVVRWDEDLKRSNVYVYIYPGHYLFLRCAESMWGCPFDLPGASFYKLLKNDQGVITGHQYGNDYDHEWNQEGGDSKWQSAMYDARKIFEALSDEAEKP